MLLSLRALFFSVPALILIVGSYLVAPKTPPSAAEPQPASSISALTDWPTEQDEATIRRVAIKHETVLDLLDGRIALQETVDRFRLLSPEADSNLDATANDSQFLAQVISFARAQAAREPDRFSAALLAIESAAHSREACPIELAPTHSSRNPHGS